MPTLMVEIDGKLHSPYDCFWLFFGPCGCPWGLSNVTAAGPTEEQAWKYHYFTAAERKQAQAKGVTALLVPRETYREQYLEQMKTGCPHPPVVVPGRGTCSVCDREMRVLKDGTIGPHTTGRPDPYWSGHSSRCPGWGRKPKES